MPRGCKGRTCHIRLIWHIGLIPLSNHANGNAVNAAPPMKTTAEYAKRGLFRPSWQANDNAMPTMPVSVMTPDSTKYDVEPNQSSASMTSNISTNHIGTSIQSKIFPLSIVLHLVFPSLARRAKPCLICKRQANRPIIPHAMNESPMKM